MAWVQFILAIPQMLKALQDAKAMWERMQDERFHEKLREALDKTNKAERPEDYEQAVIAWRNAMRAR